MSNKTCIVVAGPTAVGKTAIALQLARHFRTSIISADSRQCYREMNIGVAKPHAVELAELPHYFINSHSIFDDLNAAAFEAYALEAAQKVFASSDFVILVGGTGLYIKAFCEGLDNIPPIASSIREEIIRAYETLGISWLQNQLREKDPAYYATGETANPQRLMRALEVKIATGESITSFHTAIKKQRPFQVVKAGLQLPRDQLYLNINTRVEQMMAAGLLEEVRGLQPYAHLNALQTVGYQELFEYLEGKCTVEAAVTNIQKHTRHYAKRQLTWFKRDEQITWFQPQQFTQLLSFLSSRISTW